MRAFQKKLIDWIKLDFEISIRIGCGKWVVFAPMEWAWWPKKTAPYNDYLKLTEYTEHHWLFIKIIK